MTTIERNSEATMSDFFKMAAASQPMAPEPFWAKVASVGWSRTTRYSEARLALARAMSIEDAAAFHVAYDAAVAAVAAKLEKSIRKIDGYIGDGFADLCAHIVGLGREEYERVLADPRRGVSRYKAGRFTESFGYCIPTGSDYAALDPAYHQARAAELVAEYQTALAEGRGDPAGVAVVVGALQKLASGDHAGCFAEAETAIEAAKAVAKAEKARVTAAAGHHVRIAWDGSDVITNEHAAINVINDARRALTAA